MDHLDTETAADSPLVAAPDADGPPPAHLAGAAPVADARPDRPRRRWILPVAVVPVVLVLVLVLAWAVDTSSGDVARNVELAGVDIGGLSEDELAGRVGEVADTFSSMPVELRVGDAVYETTTADLGLTVDEGRTTESALEVGESSFVLARPFAWAWSLVSTRRAPLLLQVNEAQVATELIELEGDARTPPTEPTVELVDGAFEVVPGKDGTGLDPTDVAHRLPGVAEAAVAEDLDVIRLDVEQGPIPPLGSEAEAEAAAEAADELVGEPLEVVTAGGARPVTPEQLRSWAQLTSKPDGTVAVRFMEDKVAATLRRVFADIEGHPVNASFTLEGGVPIIRPGQDGTICCAEGSGATILTALESGTRRVELDLVQGPPSFTTADAEAYGIKEPVGGNHAWRDGAPTTAAAGFTTYHDPSGARITNIHRMADIVRGAVVAPGDTFSINEHVGERTAEKGFVPAGAIRDGKHVEEIGGGVSQFATTMFNAVYFAGLKIDESQAHSEYFSRYPRGREATMGYPAPDLRWTNNTPYGIMVWTSYTQSSLTITLYSTPHARAEQTAISESRVGNCTVVTTTRTITYPDGATEQDRFRATYRPGEGQRC
jgi:vancomycin resistance protein YoaR